MDLQHTKWTQAQLPSMTGRTVFVTGGASGIGFQASKALAACGARVIVLGRDRIKGEAAVEAIREHSPDAVLEFQEMDLGRLASIAAFAERWLATGDPVHLLLNVAGVMAVPRREATADGFEVHMGTNFLGHFALTAHLLPALRSGHARIVTVSAAVGRWNMARLDPEDLHAERQSYSPMGAYARSKLAGIMFAVELHRRASACGITSVAVDPGTAVTNLQRNVAGLKGAIGRALSTTLGYPLTRAAENVLFAATMSAPTESSLIGPSPGYVVQRCASPGDVGIPPLARDARVREALWRKAELLTAVTYSFTQH
ncbi:SDR family oxidoreductase [Pendulispora brunnea]|uniref:SDR family oxidoreductase n=1 Tax=Pendulispora brunnea TaxID=2905690 RepID=A0ABZ2KBR4_9BACT